MEVFSFQKTIKRKGKEAEREGKGRGNFPGFG
jgi:hypothetical protein